MVYSKTGTIVTILIASVLVIGCGGGDAKVQSNTMGQQLMELKESHDKGALTEKEYETARKQVMRRYR